MTRIVRSPQFAADLESIWLAIATKSPNSADRVVIAIDRTVGYLRDFSKIGTSCDHLAPGLRRLLWREYLIFYRVKADHIELVRVLHGRRDIKSEDFE